MQSLHLKSNILGVNYHTLQSGLITTIMRSSMKIFVTCKPRLSGSTAILPSQRKHSTPTILTFNNRFLRKTATAIILTEMLVIISKPAHATWKPLVRHHVQQPNNTEWADLLFKVLNKTNSWVMKKSKVFKMGNNVMSSYYYYCDRLSCFQLWCVITEDKCSLWCSFTILT